jgi:NADPH:quinone reductase
MYAIWYERTGPADQVLTFGEIDTPRPGPEDVLVRVRTSGVNPSDTKRRSGNQPMAFPRVIPHSDGAGIIEAVGSAVPASRVGERVWLWNAQFGRPFGTAAEYVALPSRQAVRLPDAVDLVAGACLGIPALTAHRCLFSDGPVQGLTVLVSGGAGAVGNAAIELAKWGGATVITTVSSPEKADVAREAGADHVIDYRKEDVAARISDITRGAGVDRVVEVAFGHNISVDSAVIKQNGVIAAYSSDANPYPQIPFFELMRKDITLRLTLVYIIPETGREQGIADVNAALEAGALRPVIAKRFALQETAQAHQAVESGEMIGNVVVEVD